MQGQKKTIKKPFPGETNDKKTFPQGQKKTAVLVIMEGTVLVRHSGAEGAGLEGTRGLEPRFLVQALGASTPHSWGV